MVSDDAELVSQMIADSFSDARERAGAVGAMFLLFADIDGTNGVSCKVAKQLLFQEPPSAPSGYIMLPLGAVSEIMEFVMARYRPSNYFGLLILVAHMVRSSVSEKKEFDSVLYGMLSGAKLRNINAN